MKITKEAEIKLVDLLHRTSNASMIADFFKRIAESIGERSLKTFESYVFGQTELISIMANHFMCNEKAREFFKALSDEIRKIEVKEEEETFYKVGDRFDNGSGIYRLSSLGNKMVALVKVERYDGVDVGYIPSPPDFDYSVKDTSHITKEEFARISDGYYTYPPYTLIKEEEE